MSPDYMKTKIDAEFLKLKRQKPNALDLGIDLSGVKEVNPLFRTSALMGAQVKIAHCMLDRGTDHDDMHDFVFQIKIRHSQGPNYSSDDSAFRRNVEQELQGYIDVAMILITMHIYIGNRMRLYGRDNEDNKNLLRQVEQIHQVRSLPTSSKEIALKFVGKYFDEILEEVEGSDLISEVEVLLNKITAKAKNNIRLTQTDLFNIGQGLSPTERTVNPGWFYYRGALTAQDTYLLYCELIRGIIK